MKKDDLRKRLEEVRAPGQEAVVLFTCQHGDPRPGLGAGWHRTEQDHLKRRRQWNLDKSRSQW